MTDTWSAGEAYEPYIGRWSRVVADEFVSWMAPEPGSLILDVGCGTGALTERLAEVGEVEGIDPSPAFVEYAERRVPAATFTVGDAMELPFPDDRYHVVVSGLVLNFVPDPARMLGEMRRVARPGASVGLYLWDYTGGMELIHRFWEVAIALDPSAAGLDEGVRFPLCAEEPLVAAVRAAGVTDLESRGIVVPTVFADFDDYWTPFLGGQGPAPTYVGTLEEGARDEIRERLRASLPTAPDGSIALTARAWAVRGRA